jgi:NAD-dependent deacetylase
MNRIDEAKEIITNSKHLIAFTGAGISVESGVPPFRGKNGIWNKYDPEILDINFFKQHPKESWREIVKMFFEVIDLAKPNAAHYALADMEKTGLLKVIITQNIDNLHYEAGNRNIIEYHGNTRDLICLNCGEKQKVSKTDLSNLPPRCEKCGGILKPDFIFFGEPIPTLAYNRSNEEAQKADVVLVVGTTGVIMPASLIPRYAKDNGAKIIEINTEETAYTQSITDIFLRGKATEILPKLL